MYTFIKYIKNIFAHKSVAPTKLVVEYDTCNIEINLKKQNEPGITSKTFYKLQTPKFMLDTNHDESGLKITTLIDKKTDTPVRAFVAGIEQQDPNMEKYCIMLEDAAGEITLKNKRYKIIGDTYFYINHDKQMITPKFELMFIKGEAYEKVCSYMDAPGNKDYAGIGTRLHQIRVERMMQTGMGNSCIVAEGNSFPFHYSLGYRLTQAVRPIEDCINILRDFSHWNNKPQKENSQYLFAQRQENKYIINWSATLEHFLCDYYKNGGAALDELLPNMFLNATSVKQWIAMIQKQPILY